MNEKKHQLLYGYGLCWIPVLLIACGIIPAVEFTSRSLFSQSVLAKLASVPHFERVELVGSAASGTVLDGKDGWFNGGKPTEILVRSKKIGESWDRPSDITLQNMRLRGSIRIVGLGRNGQGREVCTSSHREGHTSFAQAAAPTRIVISNVWIEADQGIPIYLAPGATRVTVVDCVITGQSSSVALYLDAESGQNTIRDNTFASDVGREVLAVDGSADNRIESNRFERMPLGGIYLYRNCGEGGTVRHQTPHGNVIAGNQFNTRALGWRSYGVWLGSRNGHRGYCDDDAGYPFGSSIDNRDFANDNTVTHNTFTPASSRAVRDDGANNRVAL